MDEFRAWRLGHVQPHGKFRLQLKVSDSATKQLNLTKIKGSKSTSVRALFDTGTQMCVSDWDVAKRMGLKKSDFWVPVLSVSVADNSSLGLMGAYFLTMSSDSGNTSEQLVYFANDVGEFYLSKAALINLKVIDKNFPQAGSCENNPAHERRHQRGSRLFVVRTIQVLSLSSPPR